MPRGMEALLKNKLLRAGDRKSTRLNSSHQIISYAVFCLKKKQLLPSVNLPSDLSLRSLSTPARGGTAVQPLVTGGIRVQPWRGTPAGHRLSSAQTPIYTL